MDPQKLIQTLILTENLRTYRRGEPHYRPVVTLSRDAGSGGDEIAQRLAKALGVPVYDRQILDAVAEHAKVDAGLMQRLDEKGADLRDAWAYALLSGQSAHMTNYRHHLVNVVLLLATTGGIIMGRGGHVILHSRDVFRLRVVGGMQKCTERVALAEGLDHEAARRRVQQVNAERDSALYNLFKHHLGEAHLFDLVLNTDKLDDWESATQLVLQAMKHMGFRVHPHG